jgi:hypothetical protein
MRKLSMAINTASELAILDVLDPADSRVRRLVPDVAQGAACGLALHDAGLQEVRVRGRLLVVTRPGSPLDAMAARLERSVHS